MYLENSQWLESADLQLFSPWLMAQVKLKYAVFLFKTVNTWYPSPTSWLFSVEAFTTERKLKTST